MHGVMRQSFQAHKQMLPFLPDIRLDDLGHLLHHTGQAERFFHQADAAGFYL